MSHLQIIVIIAVFIQFVFEYVLKTINERHVASLRKEQPDESNSLMDAETWDKASGYAIDKSRFSRSEDTFGFIVFIPLFLFVFPWVYGTWSTDLNESIWKCSIVTVCFLSIVQIPNLFFDWKRQFGLEAKYGFNKSTYSLWIKDKFKEIILGFILGFLLLSILLFLYRFLSERSPDYWWLVSFGVFFVLQLALMILWPKFILHLFNKLSPLEEGELKARLMNLAEKTGFKTKSIEVIDGSRRSGHSNAYFTGFGKFRRIVLYDTLIEQMNEDEIEAVLAHEIGHYKLGHIPKRLLLSFIMGTLVFWLISTCLQSKWIYLGLGLEVTLVGSLSSLLVGLSMTLGALGYWFSPLSNQLSRKHEYEADEFAKNAVGTSSSLVSALRKLHVENLSFPFPHSLISTFHHSHPTLMERERALLR